MVTYAWESYHEDQVIFIFKHTGGQHNVCIEQRYEPYFDIVGKVFEETIFKEH
jgi:hypothetical protein